MPTTERQVSLLHKLAHFSHTFGGLRTSHRVRLGFTTSFALWLGGCPQLLSDDFKKIGDDSVPSDGGRGGTTTANNVSTGLVIDGTGGTDTSSNTGGEPGTTSTVDGAAGARDMDTSTNNNNTDTTSSSTTGGVGGMPHELGPTLVFATNLGEVYASNWDVDDFGPAVLWNTVGGSVGFVESHLSPDRSWAVTAYQEDAGVNCTLWVHRHKGTEAELLEEIAMGDGNQCLTARSFDLAFEQNGSRALLAYGTNMGDIVYRLIDSDGIQPRRTLNSGFQETTINWLRLVPDLASERIMLGYSAAVGWVNPDERLIAREWNGTEFAAATTLANNGALLNSASFDFAYYQSEVLAIRGDAIDNGLLVRVRNADNAWGNETLREAGFNATAEQVELRTMPYGVGGIAYDAEGSATRFGGLFWQEGEFAEDALLDTSVPASSEFETASSKMDITRFGEVAVAVYVNEYTEKTSLGWAVRRPDTDWEVQSELRPIPFPQQSQEAYSRSIRLARAGDGVILVFADDQGLFSAFMADLELGFSEPVPLDASVDGVDSTPFAVAGPFP